jgi:hypothetical protein
MFLLAAFAAQPALAWNEMPTAPEPAPAPSVAEVTAIDITRASVAVQLVALDYTTAQAREAVALLTPEDLAVLGANPAMLQRAADEDLANVREAWIIGILIVGGLIALAIAGGEGFASFN